MVERNKDSMGAERVKRGSDILIYSRQDRENATLDRTGKMLRIFYKLGLK